MPHSHIHLPAHIPMPHRHTDTQAHARKSAGVAPPNAPDGDMLTPTDLDLAAARMATATARLRLAASAWRGTPVTASDAAIRRVSARLQEAGLAIQAVTESLQTIERKTQFAEVVAAQIEAAQREQAQATKGGAL